ncbi:MAG: tetratricopeptide repeat protein [Candidatus Hydrogenedentota bacterium]
MIVKQTTAGAMLVLSALATGCATTGAPGELENTVYRNNEMLRNMQRDMDSSVENLDNTVANLETRLDENEGQMRTVRGISEENQHQLETLRQRLDEFASTMYRHFDLTPGSGAADGWRPLDDEDDVDVGDPVIDGGEGDEGEGDEGEGDEQPVALRPDAELETPADPMAVYEQAQRNFMDNNYQEALTGYEQLLGRHPDWEHAHNAQFWKAESHMNMEEYPEAIREYQRLREEYPESSKVPYSLYNQAIAHVRLGQTEDARELLEQLTDEHGMHETAERAAETLRRL